MATDLEEAGTRPGVSSMTGSAAAAAGSSREILAKRVPSRSTRYRARPAFQTRTGLRSSMDTASVPGSWTWTLAESTVGNVSRAAWSGAVDNPNRFWPRTLANAASTAFWSVKVSPASWSFV